MQSSSFDSNARSRRFTPARKNSLLPNPRCRTNRARFWVIENKLFKGAIAGIQSVGIALQSVRSISPNSFAQEIGTNSQILLRMMQQEGI